MEQAIATVVGMVITGVFSTVVAIINSNSRQARTEQKFLDAQEQMQKNLDAINKRMGELSETDSCCVRLREDVKDIKANIENLAATLEQFKATSDVFDEKLQNAFMAIASDRISQGHRYFMQRGEITESSKMSLHKIYESYKAFGGNGYVETEMEDIDTLTVI